MCAGLAWDHRGVCLAIATDCTLFVAAVRINHTYALCGDTLVYAHMAPSAHEQSLSFWNTRNDESHHKSTPTVLALCASDRYVAVATSDGTWAKQSLAIYNTIGSPVDSRVLPFEASMLAMTADHVVACSADLVYVWRFCTPEVRRISAQTSAAATALRSSSALRIRSTHRCGGVAANNCRTQGRVAALEGSWALSAETHEFIFHVEEGVPSHMGSIESYVPPSTISATPAVAVAARCSTLLIAHRDGAAGSMLSKLQLPELQHREVMHVPVVVQRMSLNCDASRLAIIDAQVRPLRCTPDTGACARLCASPRPFSLLPSPLQAACALFNELRRAHDIRPPQMQNRLLILGLKERDEAAGTPYKQLRDVVQDVWDARWAEDDAAGLAIMEKAKLCLLQGATTEPPAATSAFLASFRDLEAMLVDLDALMATPQVRSVWHFVPVQQTGKPTSLSVTRGTRAGATQRAGVSQARAEPGGDAGAAGGGPRGGLRVRRRRAAPAPLAAAGDAGAAGAQLCARDQGQGARGRLRRRAVHQAGALPAAGCVVSLLARGRFALLRQGSRSAGGAAGRRAQAERRDLRLPRRLRRRAGGVRAHGPPGPRRAPLHAPRPLAAR